MRDGRLIIASSKGLQLCEIRRDSLIVLKNFASTSPNTSPHIDRYPTNGITDLAVDTVDDIVCTTASALGSVVLYKYNATASDLEKIAVFDTTNNYWAGAITNADLDPNFNTLYVVDPSTKKLYYSEYSGEGVEDFSSYKLFCLDHEIINPTRIKASSTGGRLAVVCPINNTFHTYVVTRSPTFTPIIFPETNNVVATSLAEGPYDVRIVGDLLQVFMDDGIHLYSPPATGRNWIYEQKISSENSPVLDVCYDSTYSEGWATHGGDQPYVAKMSLYNGSPVYETQTMPTGAFQATDIAYSPKGNFLSISGNNQLMLLRISDG
jgi:hypothetical protein